MKKKVGILTYSYGCNYGGTLQCLGLYKFLEKNFNCEGVILNYYPKKVYGILYKYIVGAGIEKNLLNNFFKSTLILKKIYIKIKYVDRILKKFENFRKENLNITIPSKKIEELVREEKLDYIVVGSDQVWLGNLKYFLNEIQDPKVKKISYAACSGKEEFNEKNREKIKEGLKKFKNISVRNKHTYNFVNNITGISPKIVCDPSILYDYKEFLKENFINQKYILTYILGKDIKEGNENVIKKIKEIYGDIKVIALGIPFAPSGGLQEYPWADKVIYDASPEEWLNYINNATFVYTDSYHGVLFSLKFNKNFLAYYSEKNRAPRFLDLIERYKLNQYIVNSLEEAIEKNSFDMKRNYSEINNLIEKHKIESINFLKKALED